MLEYELADPSMQRQLPIAGAVVDRALLTVVPLPEYGRPRSLSLDEDPTADPPLLEVLRERDLAIREVRVIGDEVAADGDGVVSPVSLGELVWGGEPTAGSEFRPLEPLPDGGSMGFATMETRASWARPARRGDRVQSFAAQVDIQSKTMISRQWLFDVDRGEMVGVFSVVNIGFDIARRRAIVIPDDVRSRITSRLHPDLAGSPAVDLT